MGQFSSKMDGNKVIDLLITNPQGKSNTSGTTNMLWRDSNSNTLMELKNDGLSPNQNPFLNTHKVVVVDNSNILHSMPISAYTSTPSFYSGITFDVGGNLFISGGSLFYSGTAGTVTQIANA